MIFEVMRTLLFLYAIVVVANARPQFGLDKLFGAVQKTVPKILRNDFVSDITGYFFNVDTSDGYHHDARGKVVQEPGTDEENLEVVGTYSYIGPDGKTYTVEYTAGKNGFEPSGAHLPPSAGVRPLGVAASDGCRATLAGCGLG